MPLIVCASHIGLLLGRPNWDVGLAAVQHSVRPVDAVRVADSVARRPRGDTGEAQVGVNPSFRAIGGDVNIESIIGCRPVGELDVVGAGVLDGRRRGDEASEEGGCGGGELHFQ